MEGPIGRYARASEGYTGIINVAYVLGACMANTILGQPDFRPRKQAGYLIASDQVKSLLPSSPRQSGGPSTSATYTRSPPTRPRSSPSFASSIGTSAISRRCQAFSRTTPRP